MDPALNAIMENRLLDRWGSVLSRCPDQVNRMHEADSELVPLPGGDFLLALTVDTIAEEIALGFYQDPETIGWMGATVSLSDLAAVGADPLGLLASVTVPVDAGPDFQEGVARGLDASCRRVGTYVLGGDTNFGDRAVITTCAAGVVPRPEVLTRIGCRPGEVVYVTGALGTGAAAAGRVLFDLPPDLYAERDYRPVARVAEAQRLKRFATCCMDTSDGLIAALDQLSRLNGIGFELRTPLSDLLEPRALAISIQMALPALMMLATPHGEFELVFTVPACEQQDFEAQSRAHGFTPLIIGNTLEEPGIRVAGERPYVVDGARIRNLLQETGGDLKRYLAELSRLLNQTAPPA